MSSPPADVIKNRGLRFLIWQIIASTCIYLISSLFLRRHGPSGFSACILSFLCFHVCSLPLCVSLFLISSPIPDPSASFSELAAALLKFAFKSIIGGFSCASLPSDLRLRVKRSLYSFVFVLVCVVSGFFSVAVVCGNSAELINGNRLAELGLTGSVVGLFFAFHYIYRRRWVLKFPIIQRPPFYSFKKTLPSSFRGALKLSVQAFLSCFLLQLLLPEQFKGNGSITSWAISHIKFFIGTFTVSFCWEISHHLLQVVQTRRYIFAPPQGSAAAETNPSEALLETLEKSDSRSLLQHLGYLDLCYVLESSTNPWRQAAFFEETGETYQRVIRSCVRPLERLASRLTEGLDSGFSGDKFDFFAQQMSQPAMSATIHARLIEAFDDFKLCAWSARSLASLTARSRREDRYGVAQLKGCNATALTTVLSSLLAVEACLGKKPGPNTTSAQFMSSPNIKWTTVNTARKDHTTVVTGKKRDELHSKAYAMADVLRVSVYEIVSAFWADMQAQKPDVLDKNWICEGKPLFGSRTALVQKLLLFLEYRAV